MFEAMLYDKLPGLQVICHVCQWRCKILPDQLGVCRMRRNSGGVLEVLGHEEVSSVAVDPIEKKPLFHYFPGTSVYSLGSWGCNFHCIHCQNWEISCVDDVLGPHRISPAEAIRNTLKNRCDGIAWTYNEPAMWFEYTLECARLARRENLYSVYVTNGYMTPEALDVIGPFLDAFRVDVKGFSDTFYESLARARNWRGILEVTRRARNKWNMHVEIVTNVIPSLNDDEAQLKDIASWIHQELGHLTPWHVTRFYPHHHLANLPPTPLDTMEKAYAIGKEAGLAFVYIGNVPGREENTLCPSCGKLVVRRTGYRVQLLGLANSICQACGADLNIRTALKPEPEPSHGGVI